ncbi:hypothetical protein [Streptomyces sp. IB2014 016-6]|uniref:hypothetical protein n=1 Tax=Streptomyces sp. IB2014 016-6 TaxID=2517818 RepID=UPI0011C91D9F|nr:hypothetical protein [Streptomyces sp. IB2014 016-6]TXL83963.1 hypothetical protein EW053_35970 [Streptomyces sp. IB2014 016-6]
MGSNRQVKPVTQGHDRTTNQQEHVSAPAAAPREGPGAPGDERARPTPPPAAPPKLGVYVTVIVLVFAVIIIAAQTSH